jgi:hypothetical protein
VTDQAEYFVPSDLQTDIVENDAATIADPEIINPD